MEQAILSRGQLKGVDTNLADDQGDGTMSGDGHTAPDPVFLAAISIILDGQVPGGKSPHTHQGQSHVGMHDSRTEGQL